MGDSCDPNKTTVLLEACRYYRGGWDDNDNGQQSAGTYSIQGLLGLNQTPEPALLCRVIQLDKDLCYTWTRLAVHSADPIFKSCCHPKCRRPNYSTARHCPAFLCTTALYLGCCCARCTSLQCSTHPELAIAGLGSPWISVHHGSPHYSLTHCSASTSTRQAVLQNFLLLIMCACALSAPLQSH